jgi:hypothetical protein
MGSAEARWGWRVVDGDGVGTVSASDLGPAYSSLVLPFPTTLVLGYGYPAYGCGRLMANIMAAYYPRYRYAGYPYRRAYYGYGGYPYRRSQRAVAL